MNKSIIFFLLFAALVGAIPSPQDRREKIRKHRAHKSNETWHLPTNTSTTSTTEGNSVTLSPTASSSSETSLNLESTSSYEYESTIISETSIMIESSTNSETFSESVTSSNFELELDTTMGVDAMYYTDADAMYYYTTISPSTQENDEYFDEVYDGSGNDDDYEDIRENIKNDKSENGKIDNIDSTIGSETVSVSMSTEEPLFSTTIFNEDDEIFETSGDFYAIETTSNEIDQLFDTFEPVYDGSGGEEIDIEYYY